MSQYQPQNILLRLWAVSCMVVLSSAAPGYMMAVGAMLAGLGVLPEMLVDNSEATDVEVMTPPGSDLMVPNGCCTSIVQLHVSP